MITTELILIRNPSPQEESFKRPHILPQTQPFPDNKRIIAMWPSLHPTENLTFRETYQDVAFPVGPLLESSGYGTNKMSRPELVLGAYTEPKYTSTALPAPVWKGMIFQNARLHTAYTSCRRGGFPFSTAALVSSRSMNRESAVSSRTEVRATLTSRM
jgi:hypothetical protein